MAFAFVQTIQQATGSGTSLVLTLPGAATANNLLVINAKVGTSSSSTLTITDNATVPNTYAATTAKITGTGYELYQSYGVQVTGGATQITVSWTGTTSARVSIDEFSGGATTNATVFDKFASNSGTGTTASVVLNPTGAGELIVAGQAFNAITTITPGTGYSVNNNASTIPTIYKLSGTTSELADGSFGSQVWAEIASAFNPLGTSRRFAVTGTGSWDATNTGIWAVSSGGTAGAAAPTAADDVFLDGSSPAVTIATGAVARSLNCTGYVGTLTHTAAVTLALGDATAGASNVALKLVAGMTYTLGNATSSAISFVSTSATQQSITWAGKVTGNTAYTQAGSWQFQDAMSSPATTLTLTLGTLDTNSQSVALNVFSSNGSSVRTLTLGSTAMTLGIAGTAWVGGGTNANFTITANTAIVTLTGASAIFAGNGRNFNGMSLVMTGAGSPSITGINTLANLTRTGTAVKTDSLSVGADQTVTGTFILNSNSGVNRLLVASNTLSISRTITAAAVVVTNIVDFMDITGAGAATWTTAATGATALGDAGGNSGITFTTPATQTWSGTSGGNWSANAWTSRVPLPQDDVIINQAFVASQTVVADMPRLGRSIDWTGSTGTPVWNITANGALVLGSLTLATGMSITSASLNLRFGGRSSYTITSNGVAYGVSIQVYAPGGTYTLQDAVTTTGTLDLNSGGLVTNNKALSIGVLASNVTNTRTLNLGTSAVSLTSTATATVWTLNASGLTLTAGSSTISLSTASTNLRTFAGGAGNTYGTIAYTVNGSTGAILFGTGFNITTLQASDTTNVRAIQFSGGQTYNITNWNVNGSVGKLVTLRSTSTAYTLNFAVRASSDYLDIQNSTVSGVTPAYAGVNSVNTGGNTNWTFTAPPAPGPAATGRPGTSRLSRLSIASLARI